MSLIRVTNEPIYRALIVLGNFPISFLLCLRLYCNPITVTPVILAKSESESRGTVFTRERNAKSVILSSRDGFQLSVLYFDYRVW